MIISLACKLWGEVGQYSVQINILGHALPKKVGIQLLGGSSRRLAFFA